MLFYLQLVNSIAKTYVGTNAYMAVRHHLILFSDTFEFVLMQLYVGLWLCFYTCLFLLNSRKGYQENSMGSMQMSGVRASLSWRYNSF